MRSNRILAVIFAFGLFLTLRGYHSRDGDQAYRLPLLLHQQDPSLFANDPFVRAFDEFNPHRGSLAILDGLSRITGLSAALFLLFALTFCATVVGIDRLGRAVWPHSGPQVGFVAVALVLMAKAGNLGTNHLFEAMLLDRLMAFGLGWLAIFGLVAKSKRGLIPSSILISVAAFIHPSLGLQIGMLIIAGWVACAVFGRWCEVSWRMGLAGVATTALALLPAFVMMSGQGNRLFVGLSADEFLTLSASVQSPQHMMPHLWRMPQWLAAVAYLVVALVSLWESRAKPCRERSRLLVLLGVALAGLLAATVAIEGLHSLKITAFQPFRIATMARGFCLILISNHVRSLWVRNAPLDRMRSLALSAGLVGDWAFVAAALFDVSAFALRPIGRHAQVVGSLLVLTSLLWFLSRHDTESGHLLLACAVTIGLVGRASLPVFSRMEGRDALFTRKRQAALLACFALVWCVPVAALIVPNLSRGRLAQRLAAHCRFGEWADDDVERLALWSREFTPKDARFVGPPGPKTFRLWSQRELAFNRAASPYHAQGLADWSRRFRDHVGFEGSISEFAQAYLADRQALERGFERKSGDELARLADGQGAKFLFASAKTDPGQALERLHVEGRYAIFRVRATPQVSAKIASSKPRM